MATIVIKFDNNVTISVSKSLLVYVKTKLYYFWSITEEELPDFKDSNVAKYSKEIDPVTSYKFLEGKIQS